MKKYLVKFGLFLAKLGGWVEVKVDVALPQPVSELARLVENSVPYLPYAESIVKAIDGKFTGSSGEFRQAEAIRVLLNKFPGAKQRDLSLAVELAVQKCST